MVERKLIHLDPEWTVALRYECGHIQHACCKQHLDEVCEFCKSTILLWNGYANELQSYRGTEAEVVEAAEYNLEWESAESPAVIYFFEDAED